MRLTAILIPSLALLSLAVLPAQAADEVRAWGPDGPPSVSRIHGDLLRAQAGRVVDDGAPGVQERRMAGEKAPGLLNVILMRCDFSDSLMLGRHGEVPGDFPPPTQSEIYFSAHDSVFFDHLMGQVRDYYADVSGGALNIDFTIHPEVVNLPHPMSYYGNHPERGEQPVVLADALVRALDDDIDFSLFDTFVVVHAGAGEETDIYGQNSEQIFSTYLDPADFAAAHEDGVIDHPFIPSGDFPDSNGVDRVLILPECEHQDPIGFFGSLGVYCFEFGLHLGMLSLSDFTPAGRPDSQGIGEFGLMGYGLFNGFGFIPPHPVAFNKLLMGWIDPYSLDPGSPVTGRLVPSERPADPLACARVDITGQEYWLLSYRLQDRDGNRIFSFPDDKNGNNIPDFWDADSPTGDGRPELGAHFDVATDSLEILVGAEWDFYMSEWTDTQQGVMIKGTGGGIYIWHIDEGVVSEVFDSETNLFNADPNRKSVDLEEADRIQDLDSNQASTHMLGWDQDTFRGEGATEFGPATLPPTDTAAGAATGITFRDFSDVVADSTAYPLYLVGNDTVWGLAYADIMTFDLMTSIDPGVGPVVAGRREFAPGTDLRGSHVLVAHLDGAQAQGQIVLGANGGQVFVLDGDLENYLPGGTPGVIDPFAVGMHAGVAADWNLPPAVGDIDHDGEPEIVLTTADGIYAFNRDGSSVIAQAPGSRGIYSGLQDCILPPVLLPFDYFATDEDTLLAVVCAVDRANGETFLTFRFGPGASAAPDWGLGPVEVRAPPVLVDRYVVVAFADTSVGEHGVAVMNQFPASLPDKAVRMDLPLGIEPGPFPPAVGVVPGSDPAAPVYYVMVTDDQGRGETVFFGPGFQEAGPGHKWTGDVAVHSPLAPGGTFVGDGRLGRVGHGGDWRTGWPQVPATPFSIPEKGWAASPLVAHLPAAEPPLNQYVYQVPDGRLFAFSTQGETVIGWPLGGPASSAGSPALGRILGDNLSDLVAIGTFDRITGLDGEGLTTQPISNVTVWQDIAAMDPLWPMWGGNSWRNGVYDLGARSSVPGVASGTGLVPGSHICYPSPLLRGPLRVRGKVRAPARARVFVYNLEGEPVVSTGWRDVVAVDYFEVEVDLAGAVSGLYLCRLVVETDGTGTDQSVVQFAVVR